jgi:MYXO-CTERM domain-containing protein
MLGFALSPDGKRAYVGLGDSRDLSGQRQVDPAALGIYEGAAPEFAFTRVFTGQIGCLAYHGTTLFACGAHDSTGFELAASTDDGRTFTSLLDFGQIRGALECAPGTPTAVNCVPAWPAVCDPIGVCPAAATKDAGASDSTPSPSKRADSGCDVSPASGEATPLILSLALVGAALGLARARRAQS